MDLIENDDRLYQALLNRDPAYDGRYYVGVASTGIFCRLTCPARKPKRENCTFYQNVGDAMASGFRPCKRCKPTAPEAENDPIVQKLNQLMRNDPERRWSEQDVIDLGLDPSTVRRTFKRHFGVTFLELARQNRLRNGFTTLSDGGKVIEAQLDAGYDSPSAFRKAFSKLLGVAPGDLAKEGILKATWLETPLGNMIAVSDAKSLHLLEFADRRALPTELKRLMKTTKGQIGIGRFEIIDQLAEELDQFFLMQSADFKTPLVMHGTAFTKDVWRQLRTIPAGQTTSYHQLAMEMGRPTATRAVARANGANQIAILIPCHRVIGANGDLTGYGGGLWRKQKLIELERGFLEKHRQSA